MGEIAEYNCGGVWAHYLLNVLETEPVPVLDAERSNFGLSGFYSMNKLNTSNKVWRAV